MGNRRQQVWVSHDVGRTGERRGESRESEEMGDPARTYDGLRNQNKS